MPKTRPSQGMRRSVREAALRNSSLPGATSSARPLRARPRSCSSIEAGWRKLRHQLFFLASETMQWEAARSTGLSFFQVLRYVVLPQAVRLTIPPLTNRTIAITKSTAIASVVAVQEILGQASAALGFAANTTPLTMAAIAYLIIFMPLVAFSRWIESRFAWKR